MSTYDAYNTKEKIQKLNKTITDLNAVIVGFDELSDKSTETMAFAKNAKNVKKSLQSKLMAYEKAEYASDILYDAMKIEDATVIPFSEHIFAVFSMNETQVSCHIKVKGYEDDFDFFDFSDETKSVINRVAADTITAVCNSETKKFDFSKIGHLEEQNEQYIRDLIAFLKCGYGFKKMNRKAVKFAEKAVLDSVNEHKELVF